MKILAIEMGYGPVGKQTTECINANTAMYLTRNKYSRS